MVTNNVLLSLLLVSGARACYQDLFLTAPPTMEALSGSCLQIPCSFSPRNGHDFINTETFGVWIKTNYDVLNDKSNLIFHSSGSVTTYPMNFTGKLNEKDCTTLFSSLLRIYTDVYFFRVESTPFRATSTCDSLQITVRDSPPRPSIEIPADLKEKESVSVSCSAPTPCPHSPPKLTWNLQRDAHVMMEENTDRTFTTKIQKTIALSEEHDGFTITCSATYPLNEGKDKKTAEETKTLNVSYAPKDTSASISPSGPVSAGSWVNLTCSSRANPPISHFTWFKNSNDGPVSVSQGDFYRFNVTEGGVYYCVATNQLGNQPSSEILLTIKVKQLEGFLPWIAVVGGIIVLICAGVVVWCLKSKRLTLQQPQNLTALEPAVQEPAGDTETETGDVHYGEIDFSKWRPEPASASVQERGEQQESLYAQVNVSKTAKS